MSAHAKLQEDISRHARKWVSGISGMPHCRSRLIKAMAVDPEGVGTLLTRYVAPTQLPPGFEVVSMVRMPCVSPKACRPFVVCKQQNDH